MTAHARQLRDLTRHTGIQIIVETHGHVGERVRILPHRTAAPGAIGVDHLADSDLVVRVELASLGLQLTRVPCKAERSRWPKEHQWRG
jgi:hypothetical protein